MEMTASSVPNKSINQLYTDIPQVSILLVSVTNNYSQNIHIWANSNFGVLKAYRQLKCFACFLGENTKFSDEILNKTFRFPMFYIILMTISKQKR